jgi:excisionase family DNA binding protein
VFNPDATNIAAPNSIPPLCVGIRQAARLLGVSERTVWNLVGNGQLPYIQPAGKGGKILFRVATLDQWVIDRETTAPRQISSRSSTPGESHV